MEETKRRRLTAREKNKLFNMFDGHCAYCGTKLKNMGAMQADHKIPPALGGADTMENLFPACKSCNHYKRTFDVEGFRKYLSGIPRRLMHNDMAFNAAVRYGLIKPTGGEVAFYFETVEERQDDSERKRKTGDQ